jgi:hypothetical protein
MLPTWRPENKLLHKRPNFLSAVWVVAQIFPLDRRAKAMKHQHLFHFGILKSLA